MFPRLQLAWLLAAILITSACASPPHKEMDQAQGAIDAARAAGAEQYAGSELAAATGALEQAHVAVTQRDYRLALNHALESRERAQSAARGAAETRARLRGDLERSRAELSALLLQAQTRLKAARRTPATARAIERATDEIAAADASLQEASKAITVDDYGRAGPALGVTRERLTKAVEAIEGTSPQVPRRRS